MPRCSSERDVFGSQVCGYLLSVGLSLKLVVTMLHVSVLCACRRISVCV